MESWIVRTERAVNLIRRDVVKAMSIERALLEPDLARRFEHRVSADDVRFDKDVRSLNRSVHVRLCREVHDRVDPFLAQQLLDERRVADVSLHKPKSRVSA